MATIIVLRDIRAAPIAGEINPDFRTFSPIQNQNSNKIRGFSLKGQCSAIF